MNEEEVRSSIASILTCTFSRSGGPGGQNVNKLNTRVRATVLLSALYGLSDIEKIRVREKLANRMDQDGNIAIFVDTERTQQRNRDIAYDRMVALILGAAKVQKKRIPTKASRSSKMKRLEVKRIRGTIKSGRSWSQDTD